MTLKEKQTEWGGNRGYYGPLLVIRIMKLCVLSTFLSITNKV